MYSEKVMEHFSNPRNAGEIPNADGVGEVGNPVCGDMMTFYIKVKDNLRHSDVLRPSRFPVWSVKWQREKPSRKPKQSQTNPLQRP